MARQAGSELDLRALLGKRRWKASDARTVLEAHRQSGLSLTAFARRRGLTLQRLILWRKRLASPSSTKSAGPQHFLPVRVVGTGSEPAPIEVVLRGGHRVQLRGAFDATVLAGLVEILEYGRC